MSKSEPIARFKILDDVDGRINALKRTMRNRILRKAARAGAKVVRKEIKSNAPKASGALGKSISVKIGTSKKTGATYAIIGPRRRFVLKRKGTVISEGKPTKYTHLVERGTKPHTLGKGSKRVARGKKAMLQVGKKHPGAKANPFVTRAWASTHNAAIGIMKHVIAIELQRGDTRK